MALLTSTRSKEAFDIRLEPDSLLYHPERATGMNLPILRERDWEAMPNRNEATFLSSFEFTLDRGEASVDEWEKRYHRGILDLQQVQAIPPIIMLSTTVAQDQITPRATGYSVWKRVDSRFDDPITTTRVPVADYEQLLEGFMTRLKSGGLYMTN